MTYQTFGRFALAVSFALATQGAYAQSPTEAQRQLFAENLMQADANGDAMLNRSEFETLIKLNAADNLGRASMIVQSGRYGMAFGRIDANGDGVLTQSEIQALAQQAQG